MSYPANHPGREAERLRIILETLAHSNPAMTMDEAVPAIIEIEKRTAKLEGAGPAAEVSVSLPDYNPETGAKFIDLQLDIQADCAHRKIHAIKAFRARTGWGLKESKDAVEYWASTHGGATPYPPPTSPAPFVGTPTPTDIADWIDTVPMILDMLADGEKIQAIKEVRACHPGYPGLKEAKDGVEEWMSRTP